MPPSWRNVVERKRALQATELSPYADKTLSSSLTHIDDIDKLIHLLATGETSAETVTREYIHRATQVHKTTNCLTEINFDAALGKARSLDTYFKTNHALVGPLHGVPVTVKDQFNIKGLDTTLGYIGRAFQPADDDAVIVKILQDLGAIVIAKTNLPQSIMVSPPPALIIWVAFDEVFSAFTPGGSTGGEGALLAEHGSLVGWGTDIGGSIRIPSSICGVYGLKPSSARLPYQGVPVSTEGQEHVPSAIGPMTRSLSSMTTVTKAVLTAQPWMLDPRVVPIPWREDEYLSVQNRPLVIGIMLDDGVVRAHPPIERALKELAAKLEAAGHELVNWEPSLHKESIDIMDGFYTADGGQDIRDAIESGGEPFIPHVEALVNRGEAISVYEYWQLNKRKLAIQKAYLDKWNAIRGPKSGRVVDVLLTPTMPHAAVPHRACRWVGYTKVWNLLDYTALAFPVGVISKDLDASPEVGYEPRNEIDAFNWGLYDAETMDGHPVGLQIVGRRFEEEKVLGVCRVFEEVMRLGQP
ncbi:Amidase signature (AS) enzyme [Glarea lozoyensis ATCC 20868]|uniref:Amidase signature (AS) enzyme n=1 Tax=Glarea lozoyensis (strain ATCC 20868 / MF5171) TaxID=1116229 RepID=S3EEQ5_GLAL2|nr:Amidase signature (AS) enzyme [Glarea lozoyensis ATCC 20868]EPE36703.1 Amidase signature (AS) enzyme [Glarea lozoyensis ATCC 20868]